MEEEIIPEVITVGPDSSGELTEAKILNYRDKNQKSAIGYSSRVLKGQEADLFTDKAINNVYYFDEDQGPIYQFQQVKFRNDFFESELYARAQKQIDEYTGTGKGQGD